MGTLTSIGSKELLEKFTIHFTKNAIFPILSDQPISSQCSLFIPPERHPKTKNFLFSGGIKR